MPDMQRSAAKHKSFALTSPCDTCPFRNDIDPYLTAERVMEIQESLVNAEFPCHKTVADTGEDSDCNEFHIPGPDEIHCAGALILLEKQNQPSQMMRIAERLRMYDRTKLDMDAPVCDCWEDMIDVQEG